LNYVNFKSLITNLENELNTEVLVYPNPFGNEGLNLNLDADFDYEILNMIGLVLENGHGNNGVRVGKNLQTVTYIIKCKVGDQLFIQKIEKE